MAAAFQGNAFQRNAFQVGGVLPPPLPGEEAGVVVRTRHTLLTVTTVHDSVGVTTRPRCS